MKKYFDETKKIAGFAFLVYILICLTLYKSCAQDTLNITATINGKEYAGTLYSVPPIPPQPKLVKLSQWKGTTQAFLDSTLKAGDTAYFDIPVNGGNLSINYSGIVKSDTSIRHICTLPSFFLFQPVQKIYIDGFFIDNKHAGPIAFNAGAFTGSVLYDSISNCVVIGNGGAYNSSRGGTDEKMRVTAISNSRFQTTAVNIGVFSQDGNDRALHLYNMRLSSDSTHCIYVHPAVSIYYDSVLIIRAGKLGQHQFSGSGNGGYDTGKYSILRKIYSERNGFELTNLAKGPIFVLNSKLGFYTTMGVAIPNVQAQNCYITGGLVAGVLTNCSGSVWTGEPFTTLIRDCKMEMAELRWGGSLITENSTIESMYIADRGKNFNATLRGTIVGRLNDGRNGNGIVRLENNSIIRWNNARPGVIVN